MKTFIYSDNIPEEVKFFTPGKRYEVIEKFNDNYSNWEHYQVRVTDDNGTVRGPINVGWPCAYLDDQLWEVENVEGE